MSSPPRGPRGRLKPERDGWHVVIELPAQGVAFHYGPYPSEATAGQVRDRLLKRFAQELQQREEKRR